MPATALLACLVIGITDGDTLTARCDTADARATNIVVRLAGIDAPEKRQPFGQRSRQNLAVLCFKKQAEIHFVATDRYGRKVGHVTCNQVNANAEQVRAGMAWAYQRYLDDASTARLEREARERRVGLWADPAPVAPWDWRRSSAAKCDGAPPWPMHCHAREER